MLLISVVPTRGATFPALLVEDLEEKGKRPATFDELPPFWRQLCTEEGQMFITGEDLLPGGIPQGAMLIVVELETSHG